MDLSSVCWWNLSGKQDATSEGPPGHLCMVCVPGEGMMRPGVLLLKPRGHSEQHGRSKCPACVQSAQGDPCSVSGIGTAFRNEAAAAQPEAGEPTTVTSWSSSSLLGLPGCILAVNAIHSSLTLCLGSPCPLKDLCPVPQVMGMKIALLGGQGLPPQHSYPSGQKLPWLRVFSAPLPHPRSTVGTTFWHMTQ